MATLEGVNPALASAIQRLIADAPFRIGISSGFRTRQQQQVLYDRYRSGQGNLAAVPGRSNHEHGAAVDLDYFDNAQARQWVMQNAARYGIHFPVRGENWHAELIGGDARPGAGLDDADASFNTGSPEDILRSRLDAVMASLTGRSKAAGMVGTPEPMRTDTTVIPATAQAVGQPARSGQFAGKAAAGDRLANARIIAQIGRQMGAPDAAIKIALAAALVESNLVNVSHGDRDSLGLFQQRPSQGWGTPQQVMDPKYAATQFYARLLRLKNWQGMNPGAAAQAVQRSAFPDRYGKRMGEAASIFTQLGSF